jgi:hypothetical protein
MGKCLATLALSAALGVLVPAGAGSDGGLSLPARSDLLVLAIAHVGRAGNTVTRGWIATTNPRTGETHGRHIDAATLCHGPALAVGRRVVFGGESAGSAVARSLPLSLRGRPRVLGRADQFVGSARPGWVWLGHWTRSRGLVVRHVPPDGRARGAARALDVPRWTRLAAALSGNRLLTQDRTLDLWEPGRSAPRVRIEDGWLMAARGSTFAWCGARCTKPHVWSASGERSYPPPAGVRPLEPYGALSPDGSHLALPVRMGGRLRLAVVDLETARWTVAPAGAIGGYRSIAWSPSGRWLYFAASNRRLVGWRLGAAGAAGIPFPVLGPVLSIQATESID